MRSMMQFNVLSTEMNDLLAEVVRLIDTFHTEERLSQFELGQCDGLRWVKQIIEEQLWDND